MENRWETMKIVTHFILGGSKITVDGYCTMKLKKTLAPQKKYYDQPRQLFKQQRHYFTNKVLSSQSYDFSGSLV